jgi:hypothetical protein
MKGQLIHRSRAYISYLKAKWKLRACKEEPVLIGVTHSQNVLPYTLRILDEMRKRGRAKLGVELPVNHKSANTPGVAFFSAIAGHAEKGGFAVCALDVPFSSDEGSLYVRRHALSLVMDGLLWAGWDAEKAKGPIASELEGIHDLLLVQQHRSPYAPPEMRLNGNELEAITRQIMILRTAHEALSEHSIDGIKALFRQAIRDVDEHMESMIRRERPDIVIIGRGHARSIRMGLTEFKYIEVRDRTTKLEAKLL